MKKIIWIAFCFAAGIALGHGMVSFYSLSFNPSDWTEDARLIALILNTMFTAQIAVITHGYSK
jgi:hypothetical protein